MDQRTVGSSQEVPERLDQVRRTLSAAALFLAPWGFVVTNTGYAWAIRNGGTDATGEQALALVSGHGDLFRLVIVAGMLGCLLLVPALVATMRLAARSWLVFLGGAAMIGGYIGYFAVLLSNHIIIAMAERGGPLTEYAAVIDASQSDSSTSWVFLMFIVGNLLGTLVLAIGLLRSRTIPGWAALLILAWPPLHVTGLVVGSEWFEVTGAVFQGIGFAAVGRTVLRASARR